MTDEVTTPDQTPDPGADKTKQSMTTAAEELAETIRSTTAVIRDATSEAARPTVPAAPAVEPLTVERLNKIADEGSVGEALHAVGREVLVPLQGQSFQLAKEARRENVEQHPELGKYARDHKKEIDALIKQRGISDQELATKGFAPLVRELYNGDPNVQQVRIDKEVQDRVNKALADAGITPPQPGQPLPVAVPAPTVVTRAPVERPAASPVAAAPKPGQSRDEAINAVVVTPDEVEDARVLWHMSVYDLKKQKFEIEEQKRELGGERGVRQVGGIPVCTLEECGLPTRSNF